MGIIMDLRNTRASFNQFTSFLVRERHKKGGICRISIIIIFFFLMFLLPFTNTKLLVLYEKCESFRQGKKLKHYHSK